MKKRTLFPCSPEGSKRSSRNNSRSKERRLSPLGQARFTERSDPKIMFFGNRTDAIDQIVGIDKVKREQTRSYSRENPKKQANPLEMKASSTVRKLQKFGGPRGSFGKQMKLKNSKADPKIIKRKGKEKSGRSVNPDKDEIQANFPLKKPRKSNDSEIDRIKIILNKAKKGNLDKGNPKIKKNSKYNSYTDSMISKDKLPDSIGKIKELLVKGKIKKETHSKKQNIQSRKMLDLDKLRKARLERKKSQGCFKRDLSKGKLHYLAIVRAIERETYFSDFCLRNI